MGLRKPTQIKRRTVDQTGRVILYQEQDAPKGSIRKVTVVLPETPSCAVALGPVEWLEGDKKGVDDVGANPKDIAEGRPFQWPEPDAGRDYCFEILPEQWIAAISVEGIAKITVIVEYPE